MGKNIPSPKNTSELSSAIPKEATPASRPPNLGDLLPKAPSTGLSDPLAIGETFLEFATSAWQNPTKIFKAHQQFWQQHSQLWMQKAQTLPKRMYNQDYEPDFETKKRKDRRFKHESWDNNFFFSYLRDAYEITCDWTKDTVDTIAEIDDKSAHKVRFYTQQILDALSPTNFPMTNPEVLREAVATRGRNLSTGFKNLMKDFDHAERKLNISMVDKEAFTLGKNIAQTPGKVVYRNDLVELIHYTPKTENTYEIPLLIVPPWINKYYIFDLRKENSIAQWLLDQGFSVFIVSWVNPDESHSEKTFEDYMNLGILESVKAIKEISSQPKVNVIGYCLGGTLLSCALSHLADTKSDDIQSASLLATLTDFSAPGDLGVFVDEKQLTALERRMAEKGYLDSRAMTTTFNMLRSNDLIWSFIINNYMLGRDPIAFDLLYWNADPTRMPAQMMNFFLRNMYIENNLAKPGAMKLNNSAIDLKNIKTPLFVMAALEDHITPWKPVYQGSTLFNTNTTFVLSASGHIAGVMNHPKANKYCHWTSKTNPKDADLWLDKATEHKGSWWNRWYDWVQPQAGNKVKALQPGEHKKYPSLCEAPGEYVKIQVQD